MQKLTRIIIFLALIFLIGCADDNNIKTIKKCINESGTNVLGSGNMSQCKLLICVIDNNVYDGLVRRDEITACRVAILQEKLVIKK